MVSLENNGEFMEALSLNQKVRVVATGSKLNGITGKVVGKSVSLAEMRFYVLWLDDGLLLEGWPTITITQHCLEAI